MYESYENTIHSEIGNGNLHSQNKIVQKHQELEFPELSNVHEKSQHTAHSTHTIFLLR